MNKYSQISQYMSIGVKVIFSIYFFVDIILYSDVLAKCM